MRLSRALAATALLAVACGAAGCDWIGSLTPFGIGTRDYSSEGNFVNGGWAGASSTGGTVAFLVGNSELTDLLLQHVAAGCTITFEGGTSAVLIVDDAFSFERDLTSLNQGRIAIQGRFTSATTCSGSYSFRALPAGVCPTAGSGTFVAEKIP